MASMSQCSVARPALEEKPFAPAPSKLKHLVLVQALEETCLALNQKKDDHLLCLQVRVVLNLAIQGTSFVAAIPWVAWF